ncbi:MAG: ABC transporter substrate-binding protein [Bacteroidales bacterium]|nr:ABC transporter substrate-binding protein [Bacteroidales bacterium]
MKKVVKRIILVFIPLVLVCANSCELFEEDFNKPVYEKSIKIGVVGDVSVLREQVESMFFGAKLASEEINTSGGLLINNQAYNVELIYKNSAGSASKGLDVVEELIEQDVDIIVGPTFSSVAIEMAEKCIENNILMMSYSATTPELTLLEDSNLIWRTCPSDFTFGTISAQYCFDSLQTRKAAILYREDRFGIGLSEIIKNKFTNLGGDVTSSVSFPGDVDLSTYNFDYEINTLLEEEPDIIYTISFSSEIAILTNEIYNNSLYHSFENQPYLFVNDGILPEELIINGIPEMLETTVGVSSTNEENENYILYKENFISRFGFAPSTYSEHSYDAIYLIAYAMQMASSTSPNIFKNFLLNVSGTGGDQGSSTDQIIINIDEFTVGQNILLKGGLINYEGASGPVDFNENGDPKPKIVIWGIENNEYVELTYYD